MIYLISNPEVPCFCCGRIGDIQPRVIWDTRLVVPVCEFCRYEYSHIYHLTPAGITSYRLPEPEEDWSQLILSPVLPDPFQLPSQEDVMAKMRELSSVNIGNEDPEADT